MASVLDDVDFIVKRMKEIREEEDGAKGYIVEEEKPEPEKNTTEETQTEAQEEQALGLPYCGMPMIGDIVFVHNWWYMESLRNKPRI